MTGKQRAYLRGLANKIDAKYQIGKGGIDEPTVRMLDLALEAKELIKIHVLESAFLDVREACGIVCEKTGAEPVQCIGSKFVVYRPSRENKKIELPRR